MSIFDEAYQEQKDFLETWPIEKLEQMTLEEYTNLDTETAFIYWLERKTKRAGGIWGGSAFKFGIFRKRNTETLSNDVQRKTDGTYAWYAKYGETKEEAFKNVKSLVIETAKASINEDFEKIDNIDIGNTIKWKIAFQYNTDKVIPIFKKEVLGRIAESYGLEKVKNKSISALQSYIYKFKSAHETTTEFSYELWDKFNLDNFYYVIEKFIKRAQEGVSLQKRDFPKKYKDLELKISFGAGSAAHIPWIAFLKDPNKVTDGIFPVFLYYKEINILVLSYGVGESVTSSYSWSLPDNTQTIKQWYLSNYGKNPYRYGSSFFMASFNLDEEIDLDDLQSKLDDIIQTYKSIEFADDLSVKEIEPTYQPRKFWIVAPGESANKWDEFYIDEIIGLGWDKIGDLSKFNDRCIFR